MSSTRYSCLILMKLEFSRQILDKSQVSNFMEIRPVGAELTYADRRTGMSKGIVSFCDFVKVPNN